MKTAWNDVVKYAVIGNLLHLGICFIYSLIPNKNSTMSIGFTVLILAMYFILGLLYCISGEVKREISALQLSIVTTLPIIAFLIAGQILEGIQGLSSLQSYSLFYIIGAPTLFWSKPFEPIMALFEKSSIYIQMDINVAVVILVLLIGGCAGSLMKKSKKTKKISNTNLE